MSNTLTPSEIFIVHDLGLESGPNFLWQYIGSAFPFDLNQLNRPINPIEDPPTIPAVRADIKVLVSRAMVSVLSPLRRGNTCSFVRYRFFYF